MAGMLLQLDNSELLHLLDDAPALAVKAAEAAHALMLHQHTLVAPAPQQ